MKHKYLLIAAMATAIPFAMPSTAQAAQCREYTKTVKINGHQRIVKGDACRQSRNGAWEIVSLSGVKAAQSTLVQYIYDDLYHDGYDVIVVNDYKTRSYKRAKAAPRVVYYVPSHKRSYKKYR